jgi:hypothetical protein
MRAFAGLSQLPRKGQGRKSTEASRERKRAMKNVVMLGSLMLVFYTIGALLRRTRRVAIPSAGPQQPLPARTYQYKEFTFSLN